MRNISTVVRGHYDDGRYMWAIIIRRFYDTFTLKSWKQQAFLLKLDLAKAFDMLKWSFNAHDLRRLGLPTHFIRMIHACISTPTFSLLVNGEPTAGFHFQRGIRQGCPLSPYLFVVAINELSITLQQELCNANLTGVSLGPSCPPIHSLLFANDLILCGKASQQEATIIHSTLQHFCDNSG
jgi:hypothetical protein